MMTSHKVRILNSKSPLEEPTSRVLTPFAFKNFQEEFGRVSLYSILYMSDNEFVLRYYTGASKKEHGVFWDEQLARGSCKNFEFLGIFCRHILRVFLQKDCYEIPLAYLPLLRWCHDKESDIENIVTTLEVEREDVVLCPPMSITKGRSRKKRNRGGQEIGKRTRRCSLCKEVCHTAPIHPMEDNIWEATSAIPRKKKASASDLGLNPIFWVKN
ncbi:hypothetical protein Cgig2_020723 [Carnegiea gigantea]|uniref:Protein FAR1-RELATED SEQUENCE n=1 Tax=Carnegiea gigantea TaxID=171969 RepID=A0A9Q1GTS3_9CARY|nr:hypothetical protein Cgig2_020723 [Carnegiea gigantea]